jgi:hypothetical protein
LKPQAISFEKKSKKNPESRLHFIQQRLLNNETAEHNIPEKPQRIRNPETSQYP